MTNVASAGRHTTFFTGLSVRTRIKVVAGGGSVERASGRAVVGQRIFEEVASTSASVTTSFLSTSPS